MPSGVYKRVKTWKLSEETKRKISEYQRSKKNGAWNKSNNFVKCKTCRKEFHSSPSNHQKYCSKECYVISPRGKGSLSRRWKGGITPKNKQIRASDKYKLWIKSVFTRDNYRCCKCHKRGGNIEAHHIKPFYLYPELRFEVSNGMTLCVKCHNNTKSNLERKPKNGKTNFVQ